MFMVVECVVYDYCSLNCVWNWLFVL